MPTDIKTIYVDKEDGTKEEFASDKLHQSLVKSGANPTLADKIVRSISEEIAREGREEHTASEIYRRAFHHLKDLSLSAAARYSLRRSLLEFGPTGFPFEKYVAEILKAKGYATLTDQVVFGSCVPHEVDVVAWNPQKLVMIEVKYHNEPAGKTDLKVALYVKARYDDLMQNMYDYGNEGASRKLDEGWLLTNTKFSDTAVTYGKCAGVKMVSWNYPPEGNLQDMIEETKLHPVTCLSTLSAVEKKLLLENNIVLCKSVYENTDLLKIHGFSASKIFKVVEEIGNILRNDEISPKEI